MSALNNYNREDVMHRRPVLAIVLLALGATTLVAQPSAHQAAQTPPIKLGTSGGNVNDHTRRFCCSGTLGALVTANGVDYILSNNHVLARVDQAAPGEDISQPGLVDNNCQIPQIVADFTTAAPLGSSNVDAAIAQVRPGQVDLSGNILEVGSPASLALPPVIGLGVAKSGRTTGLTCGMIGSISTTVNVQYQK